MSTRYEILDAKNRRDNHTCNDLVCGFPCPVRIALYTEHLRIAGRWGMDEDGESHDARQRRHYYERVKTGSTT